MLDVSSQMTFRVHADGNGRLTLRFRRLFEDEGNRNRWQYDVALDDKPEDVVPRLRDIATQVLAAEHERLGQALTHLRGSEAKQRKTKP